MKCKLLLGLGCVLLLNLCGCDTQQQKEDKLKAILQAQKDSSDLVMKKEVKTDLKKAYFNLTRIKDLDKTGIPFYNNDMEDVMMLGLLPMSAMMYKPMEFVPVNIDVSDLREDSATISYELRTMVEGEVKNKKSVTMLARKIGDEWKFDSKKFLPEIDGEKRDRHSSGGKRKAVSKQNDTIAEKSETE